MRRPSFVLLGSPVRHSVSPAVYRAAFRALGIEATYRTREVGVPAFVPALREAAAGGGGNVTAPHKERAAAALDRATEAVRATGACNCFWAIRDGGARVGSRDADGWGADGRGAEDRDVADRRLLAGDNTDVEGFLAAVRALPLPRGLAGSRVVVLGAGGAARAVVHACLGAGAEAIDVRNRTPARAEALVRGVAAGDPRVRAVPWDGPAAGPFDLAVNATPLGREAADPALPPATLLGAGAALDLVYAPGGTDWAVQAAASGLPAADGLEMLVRQAACSLQRWFPAVVPPLDAMRSAARRWLADAEAERRAVGGAG